jgi:hypothetical protein
VGWGIISLPSPPSLRDTATLHLQVFPARGLLGRRRRFWRNLFHERLKPSERSKLLFLSVFAFRLRLSPSCLKHLLALFSLKSSKSFDFGSCHRLFSISASTLCFCLLLAPTSLEIDLNPPLADCAPVRFHKQGANMTVVLATRAAFVE